MRGVAETQSNLSTTGIALQHSQSSNPDKIIGIGSIGGHLASPVNTAIGSNNRL